MSITPASTARPSQSPSRLNCEDVRFAEVDFVCPISPRLVVQFSEGLNLLIEDHSAINLAAEFIVAFRCRESAAITATNNATGKEPS